jgi:hypothetical protein
MCWNQHVSLNTFLFSSFVLLLIIYNNAFTQYKIKDLNNFWVYAFFMSFILMQLIEFFIWRNINDKYYNNVFTSLAALLLLFQPVISLMIVSNKTLKIALLMIYLLAAIPYFIYILLTKNIHSIIGKNGHLNWLFFTPSTLVFLFWLFFFLFSLVYEKKWSGFLFGFILMCVSWHNYTSDHTFGSMWCWVVNSIMIYYAIYLLVYLPFCGKGLCHK